jgi:hypothetical protein
LLQKNHVEVKPGGADTQAEAKQYAAFHSEGCVTPPAAVAPAPLAVVRTSCNGHGWAGEPGPLTSGNRNAGPPEKSYENFVRDELAAMGSPDAAADVASSEKYIEAQKGAGTPANITAAVMYATLHHGHVPNSPGKHVELYEKGAEEVRSASHVFYKKRDIEVFQDEEGDWVARTYAFGGVIRASNPSHAVAIDKVKLKIDEHLHGPVVNEGASERWRATVIHTDSGNRTSQSFRNEGEAEQFAHKHTNKNTIVKYGPDRSEQMSHEVRRDVDEVAIENLDLFIENTGELYPQKKQILENVRRRIANGTYDPALAPQLWLYWVDAGAKRYAIENGGSWSRMFPLALREKLAARVATREYNEIMIQEGRGGMNEAGHESPKA